MGDTVRCHYCDGCLLKWEHADDPWVEHARWFPYCNFVLKIKGRKFIQASTARSAACGLQTPVTQPAAALGNEDTWIISFVDACKILEQRNPMHSAAARSMKEMGYSRATIRVVIKTFIDLTGRQDCKAADLMDIIIEMEEAGGLASNGFPIKMINDDDDDDDDDEVLAVEAIREEIEHLREKTKCIVCDEKDRCIVFLPCGHILTDQKDEDETDTIPWPDGIGTKADDKGEL